MDDFWEQLNQLVINTTGGQAAADERKKDATRRLAEIKDSQGVNVARNTDGTLKQTWADKVTSWIPGLSTPTMTEVDQGMRTINQERQSAELIGKNPNIDYTGIDRSDFEAVEDRTTLAGLNQKAKDAGITAPDFTKMKVDEARKTWAALQKGKTAADNGVTLNLYNEDGSVRTDLGNLTKETLQGEQGLKDEILQGSVTYKDAQADRIRNNQISDRDFGLRSTQLLAEIDMQGDKLALDRSKLDYEMRQADLDREYLNTKDQREYNYRLKKDDMDRFDKVMTMILGSAKGLF